jgi:hypothetical protein
MVLSSTKDNVETEQCRGITRDGTRCERRLLDEDYCPWHWEQGEYERELQHAYAAHTAVY